MTKETFRTCLLHKLEAELVYFVNLAFRFMQHIVDICIILVKGASIISGQVADILDCNFINALLRV